MNKSLLNNKLDELKVIIEQIEDLEKTLMNCAYEQAATLERMQSSNEEKEKIDAEMDRLKEKELENWYTLFDMDKEVDKVLIVILAQFEDGKKAQWRGKMEDRHPGMIARFDYVCEFLDEMNIKMVSKIFDDCIVE